MTDKCETIYFPYIFYLFIYIHTHTTTTLTHFLGGFGENIRQPTDKMHHIIQSKHILAQTNLLINTVLGLIWCVTQTQFINNSGEALDSLVNTSSSVWKVSCHMSCAQHWDRPTYFAYPQSKTGGESQDFPNQMTEKSLSQWGAAMWQICNKIRLLFWVLGWLRLCCWEGKGKSVADSTHSP